MPTRIAGSAASVVHDEVETTDTPPSPKSVSNPAEKPEGNTTEAWEGAREEPAEESWASKLKDLADALPGQGIDADELFAGTRVGGKAALDTQLRSVDQRALANGFARMSDAQKSEFLDHARQTGLVKTEGGKRASDREAPSTPELFAVTTDLPKGLQKFLHEENSSRARKYENDFLGYFNHRNISFAQGAKDLPPPAVQQDLIEPGSHRALDEGPRLIKAGFDPATWVVEKLDATEAGLTPEANIPKLGEGDSWKVKLGSDLEVEHEDAPNAKHVIKAQADMFAEVRVKNGGYVIETGLEADGHADHKSGAMGARVGRTYDSAEAAIAAVKALEAGGTPSGGKLSSVEVSGALGNLRELGGFEGKLQGELAAKVEVVKGRTQLVVTSSQSADAQVALEMSLSMESAKVGFTSSAAKTAGARLEQIRTYDLPAGITLEQIRDRPTLALQALRNPREQTLRIKAESSSSASIEGGARKGIEFEAKATLPADVRARVIALAEAGNFKQAMALMRTAGAPTETKHFTVRESGITAGFGHTNLSVGSSRKHFEE